jgi:hypothetical protein
MTTSLISKMSSWLLVIGGLGCLVLSFVRGRLHQFANSDATEFFLLMGMILLGSAQVLGLQMRVKELTLRLERLESHGSKT